MTETVITVQGSFSKLYPAEIADATITVHIEGSDREAVFASATSAAAQVTAFVEESTAIKWSSDRVQMWSEKPWNDKGKQLPLISHAQVGFSARFSDFGALASWIERLVTIDGVTITSIEWGLSEGSRTTATAEVRSRAVKDAVAKASIYAQSIGLGKVTATALADPGMLGVSGGAAPISRALKTAASVGPELSLKPDAIEIVATVDARFVAS